MNLTSPSQVKAWCIENEFHPNKVLGQNFLIDRNALVAIVDAGLAGEDAKRKMEKGGCRVLEIGPGLGVLTEEMLAFYSNYKESIGKSKLTEKLLKEQAKGKLASIVTKTLMK